MTTFELINEIHHIVIYVSNMDAAVKFYSEVLGLAKGYESPSWTEIKAGSGTYVGLHIADDVPKGSSEVVFSVPSVQEAMAVLKTRGVNFLGKPVEVHLDTWVVHFTDPDNNALAIYGGK